MARVNEALNQLGENSLSGMKLLQEVIRSPDCPLDVRIQCAGLLLKHELPLDQEQKYVVKMPPQMPGNDQPSRLAVWAALYANEPVSGQEEDPEWDNAVKIILDKLPTRKTPDCLQ